MSVEMLTTPELSTKRFEYKVLDTGKHVEGSSTSRARKAERSSP
jgi:hypothetical protein